MDNAHLLDATEIFRKLNVHKKVCHIKRVICGHAHLTNKMRVGIIYQARFPPNHVLLLSYETLTSPTRALDLTGTTVYSMIVALIRDESH